MNPYKSLALARARKAFVYVNQHKDLSVASGLTLKSEKSLLCKELKEIKDKVQIQKSLTDKHVNKEKETKQMLDSLQKYSEPRTLDIARTAAQIRDNIKKKMRKYFVNDYEELRVAHMVIQERFDNELQVKRDKNVALQSKLNRISVS